MIKPVFYIVFYILTFHLKAQENLVPNGGFEEFNWCPTGVADFSVNDWYSPTGATPDYYHECSLGDTDIPFNFVGQQQPNSGSAYAGFLAGGFSLSQPNAREYLQVKLHQKLLKSKLYELSCFLSLAEISRFNCTKIGYAFSEFPINDIISSNIVELTNLSSLEVSAVGDTTFWNETSSIYLANGNEAYLTIGIFEDDENADYNLFNEANEGLAYYYIDDVYLGEYDYSIIPNVFSPNGDGINDLWSFNLINDYNLIILNRWGEIVFQQESKDKNVVWDGQSLEMNHCAEGVYYYIISKNNFKKTGFIQLVR